MSSSIWLCSVQAFLRKKTAKNIFGQSQISTKDRPLIAKRMIELANNWTNGVGYENAKDMNWNNFETFKWIFETYTRKPYDPAEFPVTFKDVRKLSLGLRHYNWIIGKPNGPIAARFTLPKDILANVPELKRFESEIINETQYHRSFNNETNRMVNDILSTFKDFTASFGNSKFVYFKNMGNNSRKEVARLYKEYDVLSRQIKLETNPQKLNDLSEALRNNRNELMKFYQTGSGEAMILLNLALQGANPETMTTRDNKPLTAYQKTQLWNMVENYHSVRTLSVKNLVKGLQKIKSEANRKGLAWAEPLVDRINNLIKTIEFQHITDSKGNAIDFVKMGKERDFLELGFKGSQYTADGKVAFSPHYMSQYTLGFLKTIKSFEKSVANSEKFSPRELLKELNEWDGIANVAKQRNKLTNNLYDADPYFFLRKYIQDVGTFNYRVHTKATISKAIDNMVNEHLNYAEKSGNQNLIDSANGMMEVMKNVYRDIQIMDPATDTVFNNMMRTMTSYTYFRLMGGNPRSGLRNATQRIHEWMEFGWQAANPIYGDAVKFYSDSGGSTTNSARYERQVKTFGLQWFNGKTTESSVIDKLIKNNQLNNATRGALDQAHSLDKELYIDKNGELQIYDGSRVDRTIARAMGGVAQTSGSLHRLVEDWNRTRTFRVAFALAFQNIKNTSNDWKARQILSKSQRDKIYEKKGKDHLIEYKDLIDVYGERTNEMINTWVENKAGQVAYNGTLDVHFEYAKWNKAQAIKVTGEERTLTQLAKVGIGQFAHYRFNMFSLKYKWLKEAGFSVASRDFTSEQFMKPLRYGMVRSSIWLATIASGMNFEKLIPDETNDYLEAMWLWMSSKREDLLDMDIDPNIKKQLNEKTFGQGGAYFLGPNIGLGLSIFEFHDRASTFHKDERTQIPYTKSHREMMKDATQKDFEKWALFNVSLARWKNYTVPMYFGGGSFVDAGQLEFGLFPSKEQREWTRWYKGKIVPRKKRKKKKKKGLKKFDDDVLRSLDSIKLRK